LVETLLVRFALLDRAVEIEDLLRSMGGSSAQPSAPRDMNPRSSAAAAGSAGPSAFPRPESRSESRPIPRADAPPRPEASSTRPAPKMTQAAPLAQAAAPAQASRAVPTESLDLEKLTGKWDALVERLRDNGKPMLATALAHATPAAVTAAGVVTIEL